MVDASVVVNYPGGSNPIWSLVSGLVGALVGGGGTFLGVWYTQRRSDARAAQEAAQRRKDAKDRRNEDRMARLRALYAPFVDFADILDLVRREKAFLYKDEDMEQRDKRHDHAIREALRALNQVQGAVALELDADSVIKAGNAAWRSLNAYLITVRNEYQIALGAPYAAQLKTDAETLGSAAEQLRRATREHIRNLETSLES